MSLLNIFTITKDDGTTITLTADTQSAPFYGYHLMTYGPKVGALDVARNGSPYVDGSRIVNQRSDNVIEQFTLDIVGTSPDDAMLKLADLYQIVYWARDCSINPGVLTPQGLTISIPGMTKSGFAYILNGSISETTQTPRLNVEGNRIKGIVLTIERTRWYLNSANAPAPVSYVAGLQPGYWGVIPVNNIAYGLVVGDVPAKVALTLENNGGTALAQVSRVVCGYMSEQRMRGGQTGITIPTTPYLYEAEGFATKTNFANLVNGAASAGNCVQSTSTSGSILSAATALPVGQKYRIFARMQQTGGGNWQIRALVQEGSLAVMPFGAYVTPGTLGWTMYDMGVFSLPTGNGLNVSSANPTESVQFFLSGFGSVGTCYIDCIVLIPCGEYYLDMKSIDTTATNETIRYNNIVVPKAVGAYNANTGTRIYSLLQYSGEMRFPPGKGAFFWLAGDQNFVNDITKNTLMGLSVAAQYEIAPTS